MSTDSASLIASPQSTVSSIKAYYLGEPSSAIIGDFVPIGRADMAFTPASKRTTASSNAADKLGTITQSVNPYEFEPGTPCSNELRQTSITDFLRKQDSSPMITPSPRFLHVKNSRSEGNAAHMTYKSSQLFTPNGKLNQRAIHKSESSPSIPPLRLPVRNYETPISNISQVYTQDEKPVSSTRRGRLIVKEVAYRGRYIPEVIPHNSYRCDEESVSPAQHCRQFVEDAIQHGHRHGDEAVSPARRVRLADETPSRGRQPSRDHILRPLSRRNTQDTPANLCGYPPSRFIAQSKAEVSPMRSSGNSRYQARSLTKTLDDVFEREDIDSRLQEATISRAPSPVKKRARSPMKKMFGEHGWLGKSADEAKDVKFESTITSRSRKNSLSSGHKKTGMIGKIKSKFEDFAEKADLTPKSGSQSNKHPKLSILLISIGLPEQARIFMELELMLVVTANSFLMVQFSQGRISVDSIKRTVDSWTRRGRPRVIEFMYDQATQRDLVAANQHNFRFHGDMVGDDIRINAVLYTWKQVASQLSIRTFCDADPVILKLLFDIDQILQLLGAADPFMLGLQRIRISVNEQLKIARQKKSVKAAGYTNGETHVYRDVRDSNSSADSQSTGASFNNPYGGLKLVPDYYRD